MFCKETRFDFFKPNLLPSVCCTTQNYHFSKRFHWTNVTLQFSTFTYSHNSLLKPENNFVDNHANLFFETYLEHEEKKSASVWSDGRKTCWNTPLFTQETFIHTHTITQLTCTIVSHVFSNSFPHTSLWHFWSPNVSPQLCEACSVAERAKKIGKNVHLVYNTTLKLVSVNATSVNARNNWLQKNRHVCGNKLCEFLKQVLVMWTARCVVK